MKTPCSPRRDCRADSISTQQATELYQRLLRERPQSRRLDAACYGMAWALRDEGKRAESDEQFQKLHDEFRRSQFWNDAAFRLAEDAFAAKQNERAAKLVEELLGAKPPAELMAHALYLKAELETAAEKWDRVAADMSQLARDFPDSPLRLPAEYWVAEAAYRQGQFEEAGKRFASLADQIGGRQEKWLAMIPLRRAQVLAQAEKMVASPSDRPPESRKNFPDFSEQYEVDYLLGRAAAAQADFEAARRYYNKTVRSTTGGKTETAAMAQWMIGETYFHQEDFEAALREYLRVEILYPYPRWQAAALLQAGKCQESLGRKKDAAELYGKLIKVYPNTEFTDEAAKSPARRGIGHSVRHWESSEIDRLFSNLKSEIRDRHKCKDARMMNLVARGRRAFRVALTVGLVFLCGSSTLSRAAFGQSTSATPASEPAVKVAGDDAAAIAPKPADEAAVPTKSLLGILRDGGLVMLPLFACSFVMLVFVFERSISLRRGRVIPRPFVKRFLHQLEENQLDREQAVLVCEENGSPIARVFCAAVKKWGRPAVEVEQAIIDTGERVVHELRRYLRVFNGIATVAPMLGLMGTVFGMIRAFDDIASSDAMGRPELLAKGISEALFSTAMGLMVAVPAQILYWWFVSIVDRLTVRIDALGQEVVGTISAEAINEAAQTKPSRARKAAA